MKLTSDEIHSFVIGFAETFCPWEPRYNSMLPIPTCLEKEQHYYGVGRDCGFVTLCLFIVILAKLAKEMIL